eukprot:9476014-Pyramimonas_sp.AAC.4
MMEKEQVNQKRGKEWSKAGYLGGWEASTHDADVGCCCKRKEPEAYVVVVAPVDAPDTIQNSRAVIERHTVITRVSPPNHFCATLITHLEAAGSTSPVPMDRVDSSTIMLRRADHAQKRGEHTFATALLVVVVHRAATSVAAVPLEVSSMKHNASGKHPQHHRVTKRQERQKPFLQEPLPISKSDGH